jgi:ABC-type antimicrobial peptide transport system permease subunit
MIEESSRYVGSIELHVHGDPDAFAPVAREALGHIDPNLPAVSIRSFPELIRITTSERTLIARLSLAFGAIALVLAAVGLYGVTAYRVARRTREIGLRMALGAAPSRVRAMVLRQVGVMVAVGGAIGLAGAIGLGRLAQSLLFELQGTDPLVLIAAAVSLSMVALAAGFIPAHRASQVDPMSALRYE